MNPKFTAISRTLDVDWVIGVNDWFGSGAGWKRKVSRPSFDIQSPFPFYFGCLFQVMYGAEAYAVRSTYMYGDMAAGLRARLVIVAPVTKVRR